MARKKTTRRRIKGIWKKLKHLMKGMSKNCKLKKYKDKKMQSDVHEKADEESHRYLQCNIEPKKVASIIAVQEQMVKTRLWKENRGLHVKSGKSRIYRKAKETVMHWLSICTRLAAMEYLKRHNNMPMILCVTLRIQERLLGKMQNGIKKGRTMDQS